MGAILWKNTIPHLASLHRAGRLVPFIGLGMSRPHCSDWPSFVDRLCAATGIHNNKAPSVGELMGQNEMLRRADDATRVLRSWTHSRRREALARALFEADPATLDVPRQSEALAQFRWPMVITTNYEDIFWHASLMQPWNKKQDRFEVYGRSFSDCRAVLRSLDWPSSPILWAIQGFLGGPHHPVSDPVPDSARQDMLLGELVIGHRQYQEAAHLGPHFRRAFSEVFRRRSLLFLGSGIADAYLTNLFSEVLMTQGQRAGSHFALLPSSEAADAHVRFLSDRLGILACVYDEYSEVVEFLEHLLSNTKHFMPARYRSDVEPTDMAVEISSVRYRVGRVDGTGVTVVLDHCDIVNDPDRKRVLWAISVGRSQTPSGDQLCHGPMSNSVLPKLDVTEGGFAKIPTNGYLYPHRSNERLVAVAARPREEGSVESGAQSHILLPDQRDLSAIKEAMLALLDYTANSDEVDAVRVGLLSSGPSAPWHPLFSLILMLAAVREFAREAESSVNIEITVVDSRVWTRVVSGTLPVHEILSARLLPIMVLIRSRGAESEDTVVYMAEEDSSLADIFAHLQLDSADWQWSIEPVSGRASQARQQPTDVALVPYSTVVLYPFTSGD